MAEKSPAELARAVEDLAQVLTGLQGSADQLIQEMSLVRAESTEARKGTRRAGAFAAVAAGVAALVLLMASVGTFVARSNADEQEARDAQTADVIEAIQACTSPGHPCYDENQKRSNERLAPIIAVICEGVPVERRRPPCPPR